ncbi:hypothetical protein D3C72_1686520 [compost metagenome]
MQAQPGAHDLAARQDRHADHAHARPQPGRRGRLLLRGHAEQDQVDEGQGRKDHRYHGRGDLLLRGVDKGVADREGEQPLPHGRQVLRSGHRQLSARRLDHQGQNHGGDGETHHHRHHGIDRAQLEGDGEPGRAPDQGADADPADS